METIYDWLSVAVFAGLALLYLQRSMEDEPVDTVWHYLPPAIACALSNWLGNEGYAIPAVLVLAASVGYIFYVLRPSLPRR
ncbi:hypothetical protein QP185_11225 [Sphingomonas aerolata]|uniref:XrtV sorting system accessory protein n=1 Tax=Sphingomonas aerolata TaxID=185951 RepID=UPI002FDF9F2A